MVSFGSLLVGVFAVKEVNNISGGLHQFGIQLLGVGIVIVYTCIVCWLILKITDSISSIRVPEEVQEEGLDQKYMAEEMNDKEL